MSSFLDLSLLLDTLRGPTGYRLLLALLHFIWQGFAIAVVIGVALRLMRRRRAQFRYLIGLIGLAAMAVTPVVSAFWIEPPAARAPDVFVAPPEAPRELPADPEAISLEVDRIEALLLLLESSLEQAPAGLETAGVVPVELRKSVSERLQFWQPYLLFVWLLGMSLFALRLAIGARAAWWYRWGAEPLPAGAYELLLQVSKRLGVLPPRVLVSERVVEAVALGLFRPVILLPAAWMLRIPTEQLEAVLAHEIAHLRRHDLWINFAQRVLEALLFYHPAVWWLSRRVRLEREYCCDEIAAHSLNDRAAYARALEFVAAERLLASRLGKLDTALAATMGDNEMALLNRVRKVLGGEPLPSRRRWRWATGAVLVAPLALWSIVLAGELLWATTEKPPVEAPRVVDQATTAIAEPFDPFGADTAASKSSESSPFGVREATDEPDPPLTAVDEDGFGDPFGKAISANTTLVLPVPPPGTITDDQVIAIVNGEAILAGDIFARYGQQLNRSRREGVSELFLEPVKRNIIETTIEDEILAKLIAKKVRESMPPDQRASFEKRLEQAVDRGVTLQIHELGASSPEELEEWFKNSGRSLMDMKRQIRHSQTMSFFLNEVVASQPSNIGPVELREYYDQHRSEFTEAPSAQFQAFEISFSHPGDRNAAREQMNQAVNELKSGSSFAAIAEKYSQGISISFTEGWTAIDDIAESINQAVATQPVKEIGDILETEKSFIVVQVIARTDGRVIPFDEVADKIQKTLEAQHRHRVIETALSSLIAEADIEYKLEGILPPPSRFARDPSAEHEEQTPFADDPFGAEISEPNPAMAAQAENVFAKRKKPKPVVGESEIDRLKRENAELREALMVDIAGRSTLISPSEFDKSLGVLQAEPKTEPATKNPYGTAGNVEPEDREFKRLSDQYIAQLRAGNYESAEETAQILAKRYRGNDSAELQGRLNEKEKDAARDQPVAAPKSADDEETNPAAETTSPDNGNKRTVEPAQTNSLSPNPHLEQLRKEYEQLLERQIEELERLGKAYRENPVPGKDPHDLDRQRLEAIKKLWELRGSKSSSASRSATEKPIDPPPAPVDGKSLSVTFREGGKFVDVAYFDKTLNAEVRVSTTPDKLPALLERIAPRLGHADDVPPADNGSSPPLGNPPASYPVPSNDYMSPSAPLAPAPDSPFEAEPRRPTDQKKAPIIQQGFDGRSRGAPRPRENRTPWGGIASHR